MLIQPPAESRIYARDVLLLRQSLPKSRRAMTSTGLRMAVLIRDGKEVDAHYVWRWFQRHKGYVQRAEDQGKGPRNSKAIQAAMGWGYWPMYFAVSTTLGKPFPFPSEALGHV